MNRFRWGFSVCSIAVLVSPVGANAQTKTPPPLPPETAPRRYETFHIPPNWFVSGTQVRTAEPYDRRIYNAKGEFVRSLKPGEAEPKGTTIRYHTGIDISSRDAKQNRVSLSFHTPLSGTIVRYPGSKTNTIGIIPDSDRKHVIQMLHADSLKNFKDGTHVKAGTVLGTTGKTGAAAIHLHVQIKERATDKTLPNPDAALYHWKQKSDAQAAKTKAQISVPPASGSDAGQKRGGVTMALKPISAGKAGTTLRDSVLHSRSGTNRGAWKVKLPRNLR